MKSALQEKLSALPSSPGVYLMRDARNRVLYVGKASSLRSRVRSYFQAGAEHSARIAWMVRRVADVETLVVDSEIEALILECNLIKRHRPYFNVKYRDDKRYPLLEVTTGEDFPRLRIVRRPRSSRHRYFGPYPDAGALRRTIKVLQKVFRIRTCSVDMERLLDRPCLDYYIDLCTAPCTRFVEAEEYRRQVEAAIRFLQGHTSELVRDLRGEMERESAALNFERCIRIRNMLDDLEKVTARQKVVLGRPEDEDYVAIASEGVLACALVLQVREGKLIGQSHFLLDSRGGAGPGELIGAFLEQYYQEGIHPPPRILVQDEPEEAALLSEWLSRVAGRRVEIRRPRRGEKRSVLELAAANAAQQLGRETALPRRPDEKGEAVEQLQAALGLEDPPFRMECVDISNLQGKQAVGSLVVFEYGAPRKAHYRRYRIRLEETPDDYTMMREVLSRRFRPQEGPEAERRHPALPDLLVVDGGKGQLGVARAVLEDLGLSERVPVAALAKEREELFLPGRPDPVVLPASSPALLMVTRMRDEAHRFAITYHRKLRERTVRRSILDDAPGIGEGRRRALLEAFGSVARLKRATVEDLARVEGIGPKTAERLHRFLAQA